MKMFKTSLILLLSCCFLAVQAESQDVVKKWNKTFNVNADAQFELENKFGDITVKTWNQNTIQVDVVITASEGNQARMEKLVESISISSEAMAGKVSVKTVFAKNNNNGNIELSVDYTVQMPQTIHFDVSNAFGNVAMSGLTAPLKAHLEYGSLKTGNLTSNENEIELNFGKGEIDQIVGGTINLEYSGITIDRSKSLKIESSFSEVEIDSVDELILESAYDGINIDFVSSLNLKGEFSNYQIDRLEKRIEADIEYGGLEIDKIAADFELIKINSEFGGVEIDIDEGAAYLFYARAEFGSVDLPGNAEIIDHQKEISYTEYTGRVGDNPGSRKVEIKVGYASITIE